MGGLEPTPLSCVRGEVHPRQVVSIAGLTEPDNHSSSHSPRSIITEPNAHLRSTQAEPTSKEDTSTEKGPTSMQT